MKAQRITAPSKQSVALLAASSSLTLRSLGLASPDVTCVGVTTAGLFWALQTRATKQNKNHVFIYLFFKITFSQSDQCAKPLSFN